MNLVLSQWTAADFDAFDGYLCGLGKGPDKARWEQRILNTRLPCVAVPAPEVKRVVRQIAQGNYRSYIDLWRWRNHTELCILGQLICRLPFAEQKPMLVRYAQACDSWAGTDCLCFNAASHEEYLRFAVERLAAVHTFERRLGVVILLKIVAPDTIEGILAALPGLEQEREYYVNMAVAWLIAECFVKCRAETLVFLQSGRYNAFVSRKAVGKCRDSYRVSPQDKQMLLQYRK